MTMDTTLLRAILSDAQKRAAVSEPVEIAADGYAPAVISEHVHLALEAGLLEAEPIKVPGEPEPIKVPGEPRRWLVSRLTWKGHQELARMQQGDFQILRG